METRPSTASEPPSSFMGKLTAITDLFAYPLRTSHYVELVNPLWTTHKMQARVVKVWDETKDARTITLKPGLNWRGHRAGQHVRVGIPVEGMHYTRTYTISSPPERDDGCFSITVKAILDGRISHHIVRNLKVGDYLPIGLPQGDFYLPTSPLLVFGLIAGANFLATRIRNIWAFIIIFCGHFPEDVYNFTLEQVEGETRAHWYVRQILGSANINGGKIFHIMSGNLSHQIEHHLFPDLCSNRYPEVAPRVEALCARYDIPYNRASIYRQFGTTWLKNLRFAFPGGGESYNPSSA